MKPQKGMLVNYRLLNGVVRIGTITKVNDNGTCGLRVNRRDGTNFKVDLVPFVGREADICAWRDKAIDICWPERCCGIPIVFTSTAKSPIDFTFGKVLASQTDTEPIPESQAQDSGCECPECCKPDCDKAAAERSSYEAWQKADEKRRRGNR